MHLSSACGVLAIIIVAILLPFVSAVVVVSSAVQGGIISRSPLNAIIDIAQRTHGSDHHHHPSQFQPPLVHPSIHPLLVPTSLHHTPPTVDTPTDQPHMYVYKFPRILQHNFVHTITLRFFSSAELGPE